jgi:hypothetical protein
MTLKREEWALLAIAAAKGERLQPVQLQKVLFLLGKELPGAVGKDYYHFTPYNYGPFDSQAYADAEALAAEGLVSIERPCRWAEYAATPAGLRRATELATDNHPAWAYLQRVVEWARGLSFKALVRAIYAAYPEFRANSVFQD